MIKIELSQQSFWDNNVDGFFFLLEENFNFSPELQKIEIEYYSNLKDIFKKHKFTGKVGQSFILTPTRNNKINMLFFVGLGSVKESVVDSLESLRSSLNSVISLIKSYSLEKSVLLLPDSKIFNVDAEELVRQVVISLNMADYEFITFKTDNVEKLDAVLYIVNGSHDKAAKEGNIIGKYVNNVRHWADLPPNILTPTKLSEEAQKIANETGLKCIIFGREKALELGMGGFCAVDSGSDQPGKFIILEYKGSANAPTIAFVGKGVTFDSGGISLKPSNSMTGMKYDMSGAAAVIGAMGAIAELKLNINVIGIAPAVENMPSGKSDRQDDILTFMNGKTAEIISTDAEGRLILADALCYAEKYYKPDVIVDIATLTGACVVALGHAFSALMTRNDKLSKQLIAVGEFVGDRLWRLPLHDIYKGGNKSVVADIANCGSPDYGAGTITAALFLENFVVRTPWAHIDIAGTADRVPGTNKGATGVGVRLFVEFAKKFDKNF